MLFTAALNYSAVEGCNYHVKCHPYVDAARGSTLRMKQNILQNKQKQKQE